MRVEAGVDVRVGVKVRLRLQVALRVGVAVRVGVGGLGLGSGARVPAWVLLEAGAAEGEVELLGRELLEVLLQPRPVSERAARLAGVAFGATVGVGGGARVGVWGWGEGWGLG